MEKNNDRQRDIQIAQNQGNEGASSALKQKTWTECEGQKEKQPYRQAIKDKHVRHKEQPRKKQ